MSQQPAPSHNTLWYRTSTEGHRLFVQDPENTHAVYDPLHLRSCKKSDEELLQLLGHRRTRPLYRFYKQQNDLIDLLLAPIVPQESEDMPERQLFQLYTAISSGSLSLFATMADSFMDLLSGIILSVANRAAQRNNFFNYPTGKSRMETIGIIVFSTLMGTVSIQLMIESAKALLEEERPVQVPSLGILCIVVALVLKTLLWLYCLRLAKSSPSVRVMAQDHRNDLVINSVGLVTSLLGDRAVWWIDPAGAMFISVVILISWSHEAYEQTQMIVGRSADPTFLKRVTYIALTHHPEKILHIDTCRAYHVGARFFVEVDIVMAPGTPLIESHDLAEDLQIKIESLQDVERAFVHVDYEFYHRPEHY